MLMNWIYDDGGRAQAGFKGHTGDCVTRAIAIITGKPYIEVYNDLNELSKQMGMWNTHKLVKTKYGNSYRKTSSARTGVQRKVYERYLLTSCGMTWIPTMKIGTGCQVHLRADELPVGKIICRLSHHLTAVIDGVIHDTFNPSREVHSTRPNNGGPLKKGEWLHPDGDVICSISERCVYGYFIKRDGPPKKEASHSHDKFTQPLKFTFDN